MGLSICPECFTMDVAAQQSHTTFLCSFAVKAFLTIVRAMVFYLEHRLDSGFLLQQASFVQ